MFFSIFFLKLNDSYYCPTITQQHLANNPSLAPITCEVLTWIMVDSYGSGRVGLAVTVSWVEISRAYILPSGSDMTGTLMLHSVVIPVRLAFLA